MQIRLIKTLLSVFVFFFALESYANSYCSILSVEKTFTVTDKSHFVILDNSEISETNANMGFEDACKNPGSCIFRTCNHGTLKVTLGTSDRKKSCIIFIEVPENSAAQRGAYTCFINGQDAGSKMKVDPLRSSGNGSYTLNISG